MTACLLPWVQTLGINETLSERGLLFKEMNLLLLEQIHFFKSCPLLKREAKIQNNRVASPENARIHQRIYFNP